MFNLDRVHMIIDEIISSTGRIVQTNQSRVLAPMYVMDQAMKR